MLRWTEWQNDNQSEQRNVTSTATVSDAMLWNGDAPVIAAKNFSFLEISWKLSHTRPIPVCKPKLQLREWDGKARLDDSSYQLNVTNNSMNSTR